MAAKGTGGMKEESSRFAVEEGREGIGYAVVVCLTGKEYPGSIIAFIRMMGKSMPPGIIDVPVRQGP